MCLLIVRTIHHHVSETQEAFSECCNVHCVGLFTAYVLFPTASLCYAMCPTCLDCSSKHLNVSLRMKRASASSFW